MENSSHTTGYTYNKQLAQLSLLSLQGSHTAGYTCNIHVYNRIFIHSFIQSVPLIVINNHLGQLSLPSLRDR